MKQLLILIFIFLTAGVILFFFQEPIYAASYNFFYRSLCDHPIHYSIGRVDSQFNLSRDEFAQRIQEAETVWDNQYGKKLFLYDPKAKFTINMIFDGRQSMNDKINTLEGSVETGKNNLKPEIAEYQSRSQAFQTRLQAFRDEINYWNQRGGAPPDEYDKLTKEQEALKAEADELNQMAKALNQSTEQFNEQVGELNDSINSYNAALYEKPEGGVYDPKANQIDIYFNNSHDELMHTLAHEMGHAIGLQHVPSKDSIMYYKTNNDTSLSSDDIAELQRVCKKQSIVTIAEENMAFLLKLAQEKMSGKTATASQ